ncbi:MAG: class I SAM-dependent methyltransferase [Planctomycetes bacterium]|nr:class I SAM-dependent methyltransferase [Planctomycetota bacterium]
MKRILDRCLDAVPFAGAWRRRARDSRQQLQALRAAVGPFGPGHFYSPIADATDIAGRASPPSPAHSLGDGVDLRADEQRTLLRTLTPLLQDHGLPAQPTPNCRFHLDNSAFAWGDALIAQALVRHTRPRHIIEVGSGYSSALLLETTLRHKVDCHLTCIEPYPERLDSLLRPGDNRHVTVLRQRVQQTPLSTFDELKSGDILFIDSSHVGKVGSDVLFLFFEVLPRLRPGVLVHVHDIQPYFEYPEPWLREGRHWNEAYLLRAFLQFNRRFRIELWVPWVLQQEADWLRERAADCLRNSGGSIWLAVQPDC